LIAFAKYATLESSTAPFIPDAVIYEAVLEMDDEFIRTDAETHEALGTEVGNGG
jgi:hypothetical protein